MMGRCPTCTHMNPAEGVERAEGAEGVEGFTILHIPAPASRRAGQGAADVQLSGQFPTRLQPQKVGQTRTLRLARVLRA